MARLVKALLVEIVTVWTVTW